MVQQNAVKGKAARLILAASLYFLEETEMKTNPL